MGNVNGGWTESMCRLTHVIPSMCMLSHVILSVPIKDHTVVGASVDIERMPLT